MKMKTVGTALMGVAVAALLTVPALADEIRARIKSVDTTANTVTVTENHQDKTFSVTDGTSFLNVVGKPLAQGIKSGDLREGRRVIITYKADGDKLVASEIKLRPNAAAPQPGKK
ncbi:MAG: hypothetical protein JO316_00510 [Abitibacteriaceae bacterium]|nr:hypothetical protein [Abditibacteriaceae bacterium]